MANVDNSGKTDVTEALQTLLTTAGQNGGGFVYVPPGKYLVGGTLIVPSGVELRGSGDFGSMPAPINTIFVVPKTAAVDAASQYTAPATVTLEEAAGIRAVTFHYPAQYSEYRAVTVNGTETYEFTFEPYPYAIRGAGAGVYVINVTSHNAYNGVDLSTNRCDNHYIDYLAGHFFNRGIVVGGGSQNGVIRNYQFNYNAILHPYHTTWGPWECVPQDEEMMEHFHLAMQRQFNNNSIVLQIGDVVDQLVYNCFNYAGMYGVQFIKDPKTGNVPRGVRLFGHGVDYATEAIRVEAGEDIQMLNIQVTAFNQKGSDITGEYAVTDKDICDLHLTDTFTGKLTIWNFTEWAPNPTTAVRVDGGELNIYNGAFNNDAGEFFDINNSKMVTLVAFTTRHGDTPRVTPKDCTDYVRIIGGHYATELKYHGMTLFGLEIEFDFPTKNLSYMQSWTNRSPTDFTSYFTREAGTVTKYSGGSADITIPALLDGELVTTVGDGTNAVATNSTPACVYIPTTVTRIRPNAFATNTPIIYGGNAAEWNAIDGSEVFANVQTLGCDHTNTDTVYEKVPSCLVKGYTGDTVCADCGRLLAMGASISAHVTENRPQTDATCTETGLTAGVWCTVCKKYVSGGAVILAHAKENHSQKDATCTEKGITAGVWCTVCKKYIAGGEVIPAHRLEGRLQVDATCTETGNAAGAWCTVCEKYIAGGEVIPAHGTANRPQKEATCTETGNAAGVWCTVCEKYVSGGAVIPAHAKENRPQTDASCTETGLTAGVWCTVCKKYVSGGAVIPAHAKENRPQKDATCTETGNAAGVWCTVCEKYLSGGAVIPAHAKENRPQKDATCTETGITAGVWCAVCEKYVSGGAVIPAHATEPRAAIAPTATEEGRTAGVWCTVCKKYLSGGEVLPPTGGEHPAPVAKYGDVNGDGKIDSTDARLVLQYAVGKIDDTALSVQAVNVDGNDKIDSTDARLILQYAVGKIVTFPQAQ